MTTRSKTSGATGNGINSRKGYGYRLLKNLIFKRTLSVLICLLFSALSNANEIESHVEGQVIVKFTSNTPQKEIDDLINAYDLTVREEIPAINYYILDLPEASTVQEIVSLLAGHDLVEKCEANTVLQAQGAPNDELFSAQWGLDNKFIGGIDIDMTAAWDVEPGDPDVIVAVIDMGFDTAHEDLQENLWHNPGELPDNGVDDDHNGYVDDTIGWDFVNKGDDVAARNQDWKDEDNDPTFKKSDHGNSVWGVLGATVDNSIGIAGVAGRCKIMLIRVGYHSLERQPCLDLSGLIRGIIYAIDNGARVINISSGSHEYRESYKEALKYAVDNGVLIVCSAGNGGTDKPFYPAAYDLPGVLSVGAATAQDTQTGFSNYGPWVDVSAPGEHIMTTLLNDEYGEASGTSIATPMVSGVAALLLSRHPDWTPARVQDQIMNTVDVSERLSGANITSGRINAYKALTDSPNYEASTPEEGSSKSAAPASSTLSDSGAGGGGCFVVAANR